jgi:hypothetical protein
MKKQVAVALVLVLLIPVVMMVGGLLFSLINPESAAGQPDYVRNFQLLTLVRNAAFFGAGGVAVILWLVACFLVIQSKERSAGWMVLAALGPIGFAVLVRLNDKRPLETDRYTLFVRRMNWFVRASYEVLLFVVLWELGYQAMVLKGNLMILYQSASTGTPTAQNIDVQNASSGMWAFGEAIEVMYLVVLLYLLLPTAFNLLARAVTSTAPAKAR